MNRVLGLLAEHGVETEILRPVDYDMKFGVSSDEGDGDEWPQILEKLLRGRHPADGDVDLVRRAQHRRRRW